MDQAQRANAAQMAARNIKSVKSKSGRRQGGNVMGRPDQAPQFAPMPGPPSGAMFGGSVQGGSSFDFAPPAGGPSFPPSTFGSQAQSFGSPSPDVSDNEGRFEGDNRATKRQFGGSATMPASNSFPPFGQSASNPFASANQSQASGGSIFPFGASQSQPSSGINFNSSAPSNTPFSFGATSQSALPSSTINFGSGPVESKPASNPFNFNAQQSQGAVPSFNFGQSTTSQEKPASTPFQFGQTSATSGGLFNSVPATSAPTPSINFGSGPTTIPASTGFNFGASTSSAPAINFGSVAPTQSPSSNLFGAAKPLETPQTTNIFGLTSQAPTSSLFSNLNAPTPTNNLFGKPKESPAPTNNLFGGLSGQSQPQPTANIFSSNSQPATTSNLFAEKKTENVPSNLFGQSTPAPATSNIFGEKEAEAAPSNIFGNLNKTAPSTLFSNQSSAPASNLFGTPNKEPSPASDLFGNLNKPVDPSFTQPKPNSAEDDGMNVSPVKSNPFQNIPPPTPVMQPKPLFSAPTPSEPASSAATNGVNKSAFSFSATQPPAGSSSPKSTPLKPVDAPPAANQPPPSGMFPSLSQPTPSLQTTDDTSGLPPNSFLPAVVQAGDAIASLVSTRTTITDEELRKKIPSTFNFNAEDIQKFFATYRITTLNQAMQNIWATIGIRDPTVAFNYYNEERAIILNHYSVILKDLKRKSSDHEESNPSKRSRQDDRNTFSEQANNRKVADEEAVNTSPNKRNRQVEFSNSTSNSAVQPSASSSVIAQPATFSSFGINGDLSKTPALPAPSNTSPVKSKRKATDELTQNTEQLSPLRREMKTPKLNGSTSSPRAGSQTSNMFKSILESPSDSAPVKNSPQKKAASPEKLTDEAPRFNPFGSLAIPKSPTKFSATSPAAVPSVFTPSPTPITSNPFSVKPASSLGDSNTTVQKSQPLKMPTFGGASGGSNFLAQFGVQAKKSEEDEEAKKLQAAKDEDFDSEEDDEAEFEAKWREKRAAEKKELAEIAKNGKGFKFGSVIPKAAEPSSTPKKSIFEPAAKTVDSSIAKPLFGLGSSSQGSGNSVFSSLNVSRTPTPGPIGSSSGSVLDGHTPGKAASFGNNIFGHLSDVDSGKDEVDDDDDSPEGESGADEDSEKKDPNYKPQPEFGSGTPPEKTGAGIASTKKSNPFGLASTFGTSSGTGSPGGSLFGRVSKDSSKNGDDSPDDKDNGGTTTPGGSLFDRITKDSNGNPVRHISTEEKENTQPSSRNIFGDMKNPFSSSFNKTSAPADQTWKPDSPIKFGTASSDTTSAPTIDVTSATPTKSGSPSNFFSGFSTTPSTAPPSSNLFGSKTEGKPFSTLFGTSSTSKAAPAPVGFGFGAPTAPTSLFPSAVASATTSRATTPGATTDGESGADADPDAERHDQIDLTAGGPGEENENIVHEVRSKATKFVARKEGDSSSPWETRGVGPLRILKHKDTQVSRILMRADPSGTIVLNKSILGEVKYEATGKTLKLLTHGDSPKGMETWILQVKTPEMAEELAKILEANKAS